MSWLNFANNFLSNQRLRAWSWINRTFSGMVFWWGIWLWCLGLFLFCFCLVRGEKVESAQDFGWQPKGEDHLGSWFPFLPYLVVTTLYCSDVVWSKDLSAYFFCFLPIFDREFSFFFSFCFLPIFDREFSFLSFLLSKVRMGIFTLGQGLWWVGIVAQGL